ncbi:hypothetical protein RhiirA4_539038 [Rhizophagus irregularis]|uniref:Uncharacterized protein n=1 Tax=Rhizophagus irregularis TaxID=588596 RepID=A0A2I1G2A0_9GLOM|nr:hypothetical protein RhiirA4_539038 [Rhizophagus irregularis]
MTYGIEKKTQTKRTLIGEAFSFFLLWKSVAELNANFVSQGVSSFFSLWQSVGFFRYGSQNLTPFLFLKKILLLFTLAKYWIFSLWKHSFRTISFLKILPSFKVLVSFTLILLAIWFFRCRST